MKFALGLSIALFAASHASGQSRVLSIDTIECDTALAWAVVLQADRDRAPEWGVLSGRELIVSEARPGGDDRRLTLPEWTTLFDCRDVNRDGTMELAVIRGNSLDYWADAFTAATTEPTLRIEDARFAALSFGSPRPSLLFFSRRGEAYVCAPLGAEPRVWTLEGVATPVQADEDPLEPELIFSQAWQAAPGAAAARGAREYQIVQRFAAPGDIGDDAPAGVGVRMAREAADAPTEQWPTFPLRRGDAAMDVAAYALAPPEYRDTLIHIRYETPDATPRPPAPKRVPGIVVVPGGDAPDLNGDGFADLVLWRSARPAPTLDALARASRSGGWAIVVTVHLFEPRSGRFAPRPMTWFRSDAPLASVLAGSVTGPFAHVRYADVDGDGRDEMVTTGRGDEIVVWKFTGESAAAPAYRARLGEPVLDIVHSMRAPEVGWLELVKTARGFHALTLPED